MMCKKFKSYSKSFGIPAALVITLSKLYPYERHNNNVAYQIRKLKHKIIIRVLNKKVPINTKPLPDRFINKNVPIDHCIWTMWWQGNDEMPETIRNCINNMKKYSGNREVIVITRINWNEYVDLPDYIIKNLNSGIITVTHFSDIIRMNLLSRYGGLWLDAGVFPIKPIDSYIFNYNYFTRRVIPHKEGNVSDSRWCGSIIAGHSGFPFFDYMVNAFNDYWKNDWKGQKKLIDYFLIDYFTAIAYEYITEFKNAVNYINYNNPNFYNAEPKLKDVFEPEFYKKIRLNNTFIRLHWRDEYKTHVDNELRTLYGIIFLNEN